MLVHPRTFEFCLSLFGETLLSADGRSDDLKITAGPLVWRQGCQTNPRCLHQHHQKHTSKGPIGRYRKSRNSCKMFVVIDVAFWCHVVGSRGFWSDRCCDSRCPFENQKFRSSYMKCLQHKQECWFCLKISPLLSRLHLARVWIIDLTFDKH